MSKVEIEEEKLIKFISDEIFKSNDYVDCSDCRYQCETLDNASFDPCSICHVKDTNWSISRNACKNIAEKILDAIKIHN